MWNRPPVPSSVFSPSLVVPPHRRTESGSVTVVAAAVLTVLAILTTLVVRLGVATTERAHAQAAADAAALAGAAEGEDAAYTLADRNGATLLTFREFGDDVQVTVAVGDAIARATARRSASVVRIEDLSPITTTTTVVDPTAETIVDGVIILRPR